MHEIEKIKLKSKNRKHRGYTGQKTDYITQKRRQQTTIANIEKASSDFQTIYAQGKPKDK